MSVDIQFNTVNDKLQQLLKQHARLKKENDKLSDELKDAASKKYDAEQRLHELQLQVSILKASSGQMPDSDKKEFEKRLNQYIKEIDKCISFLSQ